MGVGHVARDKASMEALLERRPARNGIFAASGGTFSAFYGGAKQKKLFKMPKKVYNDKTKVSCGEEGTKRRRER